MAAIMTNQVKGAFCMVVSTATTHANNRKWLSYLSAINNYV